MATKQMQIVKNVECFAIVTDQKKHYLAIGQNLIAEAETCEQIEEMVEQKEWRVIVSVASIIAQGLIEDHEQGKAKPKNEAKQ